MSDDESDNNDNINADIFLSTKPSLKREGGRPSKKEKYKKEREDILNKLKTILGVVDIDRFYLHDIENNEVKMKQVLDLKDDIEKYFTSKNNSVFRNKEKAMKPHTSLIRLVLKEMDYEVIVTQKTIIRDKQKVISSVYVILKKDVVNNK